MDQKDFPPDQDFSRLSAHDLLEARDYHQSALAQMHNVALTAIGRFRFRDKDKDDLRPRSRERRSVRTLVNSDLRDTSYPCILVFVKGWVPIKDFESPDKHLDRDIDPSQNLRHIVPQFLYLQDGRAVPTCVIQVDMMEKPPESLPWTDIRFPDNLFGGGYCVTSKVQSEEHIGTVSCLVTDGERLYALTARHVTGPPHQQIYTRCRGEERLVGESAENQLRSVTFSDLYPGWPGERALCVQDAGLICLRDAQQWTAQVFGIGELGSVADLNTTNISLDVIGYPVRSFGARSRDNMLGEVFGLFPRFKTVGGVDYVADVLIGPRRKDKSGFRIEPGDSGRLWVVDPPADQRRFQPLAITWAAMDFEGGQQPYQLALASFVSTICRCLDVEIVTGYNVGYRPVWGYRNHRAIAEIAHKRVRSSTKLGKQLLGKQDARVDELQELGVVPDRWKRAPYHRGKEGPSHYANLDLESSDGVCLSEIPLDPADWYEFYKNLNVHGRQHGALPFRVWQVFDETCDILRGTGTSSKLRKFFCACGLIAHYVSDACNPAHVTRLGRGAEGWEKNKRSDFHSVWDNPVLDESLVVAEYKTASVSSSIGTGSAAAARIRTLMQYTLRTVPLEDFVEPYTDDPDGAESAARQYVGSAKGKKALAKVAARGCELLVSLWKSAWRRGKGSRINSASILAWRTKDLYKIYGDKQFLESLSLKELRVVNGRIEKK